MPARLRPTVSARAALTAALALAAAVPARAVPPVDALTMERIADQGFNHGQVLRYVETLTDGIGGRLTNSPAMREAERYAREEFERAGLRNVHAEGFEFGRGWWIEAASVRMVSPRPLALRAIPVAWTPATDGELQAPLVVAPMRTVKDFAQYAGTLKGAIVLISAPDEPKDDTEAPFLRLTETDLARQDHYELPHTDAESLPQSVERYRFAAALDAFLAAEGALGWARMSVRPGGLVHGEGYRYRVGDTPRLPGVEIAQEDYRRLARLARKGPVTLALNSRVHYDDRDTKAYNVLAELPGRDPKAGYVMAGAHLDSWVAADGAADNGAGSAVVMEAARILASLHVAPKRTIRFALWAGEEQGLHGSANYIEQHVAHFPVPADPSLAEAGPYRFWDGSPVTPLPGYAELAAYFNIDNGSGKIRGLHAEGNFGAVHLLREWLGPFAPLNAATVVASPTGGTDHVLFSRLGLPAFQFVQDPLDYSSRVHHSNLDTYDHLRGDDLRQAAVILATLLLDAADADAPLPRKPLPSKPEVTDPFKTPAPTP